MRNRIIYLLILLFTSSVTSQVITQDKIKKVNGLAVRKQALDKNAIRGYAIAALYQIKHLSKSDRVRVLNHALQMNKV